MIYQWTGQPGHGKTLLSLEQALDFKKKGRMVYACNVRKLDYQKTGFLPLTLEEFKSWMDLPDGSVIWLDESYMAMPKRSPGRPVPPFVDELARHRHRGFDFIFVTQSPSTQVDSFVHDLIEEHYHVRRRFGLPVCHIRRFDRYERNPEKTQPLTLKRRMFPKKLFGMYESTEMDTSQKRVPWYYPATFALLVVVVGMMFYSGSRIKNRLDPNRKTPGTTPRADGALATAAKSGSSKDRGTVEDYLDLLEPRIPSQPWSARIYDGLSVGNEPPRVYCMESKPGEDAEGNYVSGGRCSCKTEQGTTYRMVYETCVTVAREGQYEPFRQKEDKQLQQPQSTSAKQLQQVEAQPVAAAVTSQAVLGEAFPRAPGYDPGTAR